jgi:hypothetical protein
MMDFLKKYKKKQTIWTLGVVAMSLVLAVWINIFVLSGSGLEQNLQASVLNYKGNTIKSDVYLDKQDNKLGLYSNTAIKQVKSLSVSLVYNAESLEISNFKSNLGTITPLSHTAGISTILVTFPKALDISNTSQILTADITKNNNQLEQVNMIQANFTDISWVVYDISTSWIDL